MSWPLRPLLPLAAAGAAAFAAPAHAVTQTANVKVSVVKPLTLTALQDMDLGTITLNGGTWASTTVGISRTGVATCGSNVICSGAPQVARFKVTGTNKMVVLVSAPPVTLTNQSDPTKTLTMTVDSPGTVTLTSSGQPGTDFDVGGSIALSSTTADGTYSGTINITVDYQ